MDYSKLHHLVIEVDEEKLNDLFKRLEYARREIYKVYEELETIGLAKILPADSEEEIASALRMRPEGRGVRTRQQRTEDGMEVWVEWEKPWRLEACESYPNDGAVKLTFEEVE